MQGPVQEVLLGLMHLHQPVSSPGESASRHQHNTVHVHAVDAFNSRHHTVHPSECFLVRAIRLLLRHDHDPFLPENVHREDGNPAFVDEGMGLHGHHSGNQVFRVVPSSANGDEAF